MSDLLPIRLRDLANDCQEREREGTSADACALYAITARQARLAALSPYLSMEERRSVLELLEGIARAAQQLSGGPSVSSIVRQDAIVCAETAQLIGSPTDDVSVVPIDALTIPELVALHGIPERTARDIVYSAVSNGWPGFYRHGGRLFADRDTFARCPRVRKRKTCRISADGTQALKRSGDDADHP